MKDKAYKEIGKSSIQKRSINNTFIGVGQLFVKPINDDKASILVRADNTLGNILLNVTIPNAPAPSAMGKKDCMLSVSSYIHYSFFKSPLYEISYFRLC